MYPTGGQQNAVWMIVIATVALSAKGILAKFVYAAETDINVLLLVRFGLAAPLFWLWLWLQRRHQVAQTEPQLLTGRKVTQLLIAAACFFVATYADFSALSMIDAGLSRLILFTFPVFVLVINHVLSRSLPGWRALALLFVAYAGLLLVTGDTLAAISVADQQRWLQGIGWSSVAAISYAVYLVYSQRVLKDMSSALFSAVSGSFIFMMLAVLQGLEADAELAYTPEGIFWSALIAVFCTVVPFLLMHEAIKQADAGLASRISLSGPGITLLMAWWLLDENLGLIQFAGMLITVCAVAWLESSGSSRKTRFVKTKLKNKLVKNKPVQSQADLKNRSG